MLTTCPDCNTSFRITAEHLKPAQGRVRCGTCMSIFSALDYLTEERQQEPPAIRPPLAEVSEQAQEKESEQEQEQKVPVVTEPPELPELLVSVARPALLPRLAWGMAALVLAAAFVTQYALFDQATVFDRYPAVQPWAEKLCERIPCKIERPYDANAIRMLSRDVRGHPETEGALMVNATLINTAEHVQAFPLLEITLFDTSGTRIAQRRFEPEEYLDRHISIDKGMPSGQPVHVVLEVIGHATRGSVSYEFEFISPKNRHGF